MPQSFGKLVRSKRLAKGWTQEELARRANVAKFTVTRVESDDDMRLQPLKLAAIASVFDMTAEQLEGEWRGVRRAEPVEHANLGRPIPIVNFDRASELMGHGTAAVLKGYIYNPLVTDPEAFALFVESPDMSPKYAPGELVFFSPRAHVEDGDDVLVTLSRDGGGRKLFRKIFRQSSNAVLSTYRESSAPEVVPVDQIHSMSRAVFVMRAV